MDYFCITEGESSNLANTEDPESTVEEDLIENPEAPSVVEQMEKTTKLAEKARKSRKKKSHTAGDVSPSMDIAVETTQG